MSTETDPQSFECPECNATIDIPTDTENGKLDCECGATYLYGKNEPSDGPSLETVSAYYSFIAPEVIALQEKILLFNEQNPDANLFTQEAIDSAKTTIEEAKKMIKDGPDSDA